MLLVVLTLISYVFAEFSIGSYSVWALMNVAFIKCSLVGFSFMELHKAHFVWRLAFISLIGIFVLTVSVFFAG